MNNNNGKDIMAEDITIEDLKTHFTANMMLGSLIKPKFYQGQGITKKEAINSLIDVLIEHLNRLR